MARYVTPSQYEYYYFIACKILCEGPFHIGVFHHFHSQCYDELLK